MFSHILSWNVFRIDRAFDLIVSLIGVTKQFGKYLKYLCNIRAYYSFPYDCFSGLKSPHETDENEWCDCFCPVKALAYSLLKNLPNKAKKLLAKLCNKIKEALSALGPSIFFPSPSLGQTPPIWKIHVFKTSGCSGHENKNNWFAAEHSSVAKIYLLYIGCWGGSSIWWRGVRRIVRRRKTLLRNPRHASPPPPTPRSLI